MLREQSVYNVNKRKQASYNKRMECLDMEHAIFEQCKRTRTQKRVKNGWSTEQAGTVGTSTFEVRFNNSRIHVVCKGRKKY